MSSIFFLDNLKYKSENFNCKCVQFIDVIFCVFKFEPIINKNKWYTIQVNDCSAEEEIKFVLYLSLHNITTLKLKIKL